MEWITAADLSARVRSLITRHHGGDRRAAARRLGIGQARLAGMLSGDWRHFSLEALAALVMGYGVSLDWLLASPVGAEASHLTVEKRPRPTARPVKAVARARGNGARRAAPAEARIPAFP